MARWDWMGKMAQALEDQKMNDPDHEDVSPEVLVHRHWEAKWADERSKTNSWRTIAIICIAWICMSFFGHKSGEEYSPQSDANALTFRRWDWWGLKKEVYRVEWRRDSDPTAKPSHGWCIKWPDDNRWHIFVREKEFWEEDR